jgi:hypothetical protein
VEAKLPLVPQPQGAAERAHWVRAPPPPQERWPWEVRAEEEPAAEAEQEEEWQRLPVGALRQREPRVWLHPEGLRPAGFLRPSTEASRPLVQQGAWRQSPALVAAERLRSAALAEAEERSAAVREEEQQEHVDPVHPDLDGLVPEN